MSVAGARFLYRLPISGALGLNITKQFRQGDWDWAVLNGGGNDLWLGCGCMRCAGKLDRLISRDGRRGAIPGFVSRLRQSGAQVIYVGYLRTPGITSPVEHCTDEGAEMDRRAALLCISCPSPIWCRTATDPITPSTSFTRRSRPAARSANASRRSLSRMTRARSLATGL
jgi:hypothetical protein